MPKKRLRPDSPSSDVESESKRLKVDPTLTQKEDTESDTRGSEETTVQLILDLKDSDVAAAVRAGGINPFEMTAQELKVFPNYSNFQVPYLEIRNILVWKWRKNISTWLSPEMAKQGINVSIFRKISELIT